MKAPVALEEALGASDPDTQQCFRAEVARTRGNASYGEGDMASALREWTEAVALSGDLAIARESKARALSNLSMVKLAYFADVRGAVADAEACVRADPTYAGAGVGRSIDRASDRRRATFANARARAGQGLRAARDGAAVRP